MPPGRSFWTMGGGEMAGGDFEPVEPSEVHWYTLKQGRDL